MRIIRKNFNSILIRIFPEGLYLNYQYYVYNGNPKNYISIGEYVHLRPPLFLNPRNVELVSFTRLQTGVEIVARELKNIT